MLNASISIAWCECMKIIHPSLKIEGWSAQDAWVTHISTLLSSNKLEKTWKHTTESSWASQPSEKLLEQPEAHGKVSACQLNLLCSAWKLCWTQTWKKSETMKTQIIFSFLPGLSRRSLNTWPWALPLWVPGNHRWDVNLSDSSRIACWIAPLKKHQGEILRISFAYK